MTKNDKANEEFNHDHLNFEDAVERLSHIVNTMENSDIDLDKMIENYQTGQSLLKFCQNKIDKAEFKLTELTAQTST